ncbi:DNA-binding Lrp family transcriptional regulator [Nocardiopsis mwathae]|uniref:DNA-binding Lrp family transcriptional regulator n=1 Tax=Nocardiopsis mwathae TaxID=1472723 RepID=A0A7W9YJ35_9ACTN|nr:DNA-binding Lrp family transcriptional regulator [Nocardiopsis mwathae]
MGQVSFSVSGPVGPVLRELAPRDAVTFAAQTAGRFPLVADLRVRDDEALAGELAALRALPGVTSVEVFRADSVIKDAYSSVRTLRDIVIDPLDWRLVRHLQRDGRASYAELARQVGLSQAAARSRVVRLIDAGVVHVTALVEPSVVGADEQLGFGVRCRGDASATAVRLGTLSGVSFLATGFGRYDIVGAVTAADRNSLVESVEAIRSNPDVAHVETWEHLSVAKERRRGDTGAPAVPVAGEEERGLTAHGSQGAQGVQGARSGDPVSV